ncbi:hypothetical protein LQZ21_11495 [Treponema sp. TIM-1]|uniref:hypothetical protein n=1 Tax=Treponema sp. TIM-1 TaxID=2898417 RepID=UPI00397EADEF
MSKRSLFFGSMAAIITVLLMLAGCSQSDDPVSAAGSGTSGGGAGTITLKGSLTAYELANQLKAYGEVTLVGDYKEVVAIHDYQDGQVVPTVLHIPDNATLTIGKNVTLVFDNDRLSIAEKGTLKVADGGILILYNNDLNVTGYPSFAEVTTGNIIGELIVEDGGTFFDMNPNGSTWGSGAPDEGTGKIILKAGSKLYSGGRVGAYYNVPFTGTTGSTGTTGYGSYDLTTDFAKRANRLGINSDATVELLNGEVIVTKDKLELNGDALVWGQYPYPSGSGTRNFANGGGTLTLQINEGKTATLQDGVIFWMGAGAPILGEGKLVVGKTEIVGGEGGWWTVPSASTAGWANTIITAVNDRVSSIEWQNTGDPAAFTGRAGATITQKIGIGSRLLLGDSSYPAVINLGGTVEDNTPIAGAQLILEGDPAWTASATIAGSVILANANSQILSGASAGVSLPNGFTTASKIGGKNIAKVSGSSPTPSTTLIHTDTQGVGATPASGNFLGITVVTADDGISSGSIESLIIDSTLLVE